jgi:hypothetical protein
MFAVGLDDLAPLVVVAAVVAAVWVYNVATRSRPGRRGRGSRPGTTGKGPANRTR